MEKGFVSFFQNSAEATMVASALDAYAFCRLSEFAGMMPDGKFMDAIFGENSCIGIVLLAGGEVCPLHDYCCYPNPLKVERESGKILVWPFLPPPDDDGIVRFDIDCRIGIIEGINNYNKKLIKYNLPDNAYLNMIIAAWIF